MNRQINKLNNEQRIALKAIRRYLGEACESCLAGEMTEEQYDLFCRLLLLMIPGYQLRRALKYHPSISPE